MWNIVSCLPKYLSVRHSFCSAEISICHRLQLQVVSSFISVKIKWKMSLRTLKIPWISSHCPSNTFLSKWSSILHLFLSWKCPLHPHLYSKSSSSSSSSIMAGKSTSMCILQQLRSDYLQQQTRWFIVQACYNRQLKLFHVLKNHHLCVTQGSFHVVTHYAYASVTAWLLKTKALK